MHDPAKLADEKIPVSPKTKREMDIVTTIAKEVLLFKSLNQDDFQKVIDALRPVSVICCFVKKPLLHSVD